MVAFLSWSFCEEVAWLSLISAELSLLLLLLLLLVVGRRRRLGLGSSEFVSMVSDCIPWSTDSVIVPIGSKDVMIAGLKFVPWCGVLL